MRNPPYITETDETTGNGFIPEAQIPLTKQQDHSMAERSFVEKFGLHPGMALLTITVDTMLFASDLATAGFIIPLTVAVAFGLGVVTFLAQRKWYGDDNESALIKALIVAGLTAIPTSLPGLLTVPAGVLGLFRSRE